MVVGSGGVAVLTDGVSLSIPDWVWYVNDTGGVTRVAGSVEFDEGGGCFPVCCRAPEVDFV